MAGTPTAARLQDDVRALLRARRWHPLRRLLADLHPADVAELAEGLDEEEAEVILRLLGRRHSAVFEYLPPETQRRVLRRVSPEQLSAIVAAMSPDDRTHMLNALPPDVARALLGRLPPSEVKRALALLSYPEDTAGRYMTPEFVALAPEMTAGQALQHIRRTGRGKETLNVVYIVDSAGRLLADVHLGALVTADPETPVTDIPDPGVVSLLDTTPREDVVRLFERYDRVALPVTDEAGRILGIITVDDVLDVAEEEATEDIHKLGGMEALDLPYLQSGFWSMVRKRGGWLSVLFLGEMLTATAMARYEAEIARAVVLAVFVPLIISSGGNSGSQAASLVIRSLALRELKLRHWSRVFGREIVAGAALGTLLGALGFARVVAWQRLHLTDYGPHYLLLAATVWISLVGVVTFGSLTGSMLPFLLRRLGFDPATSSAPFVATLVDVTGLVIYFTVAALLLRGALL
jgi:magnesium transporter